MLGITHTLRRIATGLAVAAVLAVVAVPAALAGGSLDGRSPDTRDAALNAHSSTYGPPDGWYGYAVSLTSAAQSPRVLDGRSPDTRDFAALAHAPVVTVVRSPGFQWGDFGIGIAAALGAVLILFVSTRLLTGREARKQTGPVATA
jgi:hypothetical protein